VAFSAVAGGFAFLHFQVFAGEGEKLPVAGFLTEAFFTFHHGDDDFGNFARGGLIFFADDDRAGRKLQAFLIDRRSSQAVGINYPERKYVMSRRGSFRRVKDIPDPFPDIGNYFYYIFTIGESSRTGNDADVSTAPVEVEIQLNRFFGDLCPGFIARNFGQHVVGLRRRRKPVRSSRNKRHHGEDGKDRDQFNPSHIFQDAVNRKTVVSLIISINKRSTNMQD
jgi:hypothetical protein